MKDQYIALSEIFFYPKDGYQDKVKYCQQYLEEFYPEAAVTFQRFADYIDDKSVCEIEEVFGFTFHIQAICYLDIGYVLFGEDYSRGEFLVNMKQEQAKINHDCGEELADNLPHVLQLIAISEDEEFIQELVLKAAIPAVEKMLEEFEEGRMALKRKVTKKKQKAIIMEDITNGNIYQNALQTLLKVFKMDFDDVDSQEHQIHKYNPTLVGLANACGGGCSFVQQKTVKK
ncbi:MAG: hypothetical protein K8F54_09020 [Altibacter sp.]|uniref:hypothetical protein n=1 Tax=Altibacter sp. TaxID=2024823 RepID=UPI001D1C20F7|nr:hypothetical protein [Altibacter sp.]MBZ0327731.1 hypothetical protein [Altibacter sp.]